MKKIITLIISLIILISAAYPVFAYSTAAGLSARIIFTSDLHSMIDSSEKLSGTDIVKYGGAARLAAAIKQESYGDYLYLDCGDFSMGSMYQTAFTSGAYELRMLGNMGCDITTLGNHEFDYGTKALADMLNAAMVSGDELPMIVAGNIAFPEEMNADQKALKEAFDAYGVGDYVIKRVGLTDIAVFGIMGNDASKNAANTGLVFEDYISAAKRIVAEIGDQADLIVCLSHSGIDTDYKKGEDARLMRQVPEIDLCISGHTHMVYTQPGGYVNDYIAACGGSGEYAGFMDLYSTPTLSWECEAYGLIPDKASSEEDAEIAEIAASYKEEINRNYFAAFGTESGDITAYADSNFMPVEAIGASYQEIPLGNLVADAYYASSAGSGVQADVAVAANNAIRASFTKGPVTVSDVFNVLPFGIGPDGSSGSPLIIANISGKDLKRLAEAYASFGKYSNDFRFSFSGLEFSFNDKRILLDRVTDISIIKPDGTKEAIDSKKTYTICCDQCTADMIGKIEEFSHFYKVELHDEVYTDSKAWQALAEYLSASDTESANMPHIPEAYFDVQGRIIQYSSGGLAILKNPGPSTFIAIFAVPAFIAIALILFYTVKRLIEDYRITRNKKLADQKAAKRKNYDHHGKKHEKRRKKSK